MKIHPNDPWYPIPFEHCEMGVTIRLKLAADFAAAYIARDEDDNEATPLGIIQADKLIEEMNREENTDGK